MSFLFGIGNASGSSLFGILFGGESPVWSALGGAACCVMALVDCTPWSFMRMRPFWVYSDSGKKLFTFFTLMRGHVR